MGISVRRASNHSQQGLLHEEVLSEIPQSGIMGVSVSNTGRTG